MKCFIYLNHYRYNTYWYYSNWCFILLVHCQSLRKTILVSSRNWTYQCWRLFCWCCKQSSRAGVGAGVLKLGGSMVAAAGCCWHHHRTFLGDPPTLGLRRGWGRWGKKRTWFTGIVASLRTLPLDIYCRPPHGGAREDTIDINKSIIEVEQLQLYMNVTTAWLCRYLDITERLLNLTL